MNKYSLPLSRLRSTQIDALESRRLFNAVSYEAPVVSPVRVGAETTIAAVLNGDSQSSLVSIVQNKVEVFHQHGNGSFSATPDVAFRAPDATCLATVVAGSSGATDLVVGQPRGTKGAISIFGSATNGSFSLLQTVTLAYRPRAIGTDWLNDIVVLGNNTVSVLPLSNGVFAAPVNYSTGSGANGTMTVYTSGVAITKPAANAIMVLPEQTDSHSTPDGILGTPTLYNVDARPVSIAHTYQAGISVDALITANANRGGLTLLLSNHDGTYGSPLRYDVGTTFSSIALSSAHQLIGGSPYDVLALGPSGLIDFTSNNSGALQANPAQISAAKVKSLVVGSFGGMTGQDVLLLGTNSAQSIVCNSVANLNPDPGQPIQGFDVPIGNGVSQIRFTDYNHNAITVSIAGPGAGVLHFLDNFPIQTSTANGTTTVDGSNNTGDTFLHLNSIALTGTTVASNLDIDCGQGGITDVASISSNASMNSILAPAVFLSTINIAGTLHQLTGDLLSVGAVNVGAPVSASDALTINVGSIQHEQIASQTPISSMKLLTWLPFNIDTLSAPSIGSIASAGDFVADITTTAGGLGSFSAYSVPQGTWSIAGDIGPINVNSTINDATIRAVGNISSVSASALVNSTVFAGVGALPAGQSLPVSAADYSTDAAIGSIMLGQARHIASFSDSFISAEKLGAIHIGNAVLANSGTPFGLAALSIARLMFNDNDSATRVTLANINDVSIFARYAARHHLSLRDLVVRIIPR